MEHRQPAQTPSQEPLTHRLHGEYPQLPQGSPILPDSPQTSEHLRIPTTIHEDSADHDEKAYQKTSSRLHGTRAALGLHHQAPIDEEHDVADHQDLLWSRIRLALREPLAEFFGVFILVLFGDASVAQVLLSAGQTTAPGMNGFGNYQSISWGWGLGTMLGIYVAGDSGAYLNPAITFANCYFRGLPWRRFPVYFVAQVLGGFVASGVVYANYITAIDAVEGYGNRTVPPAPNATAAIFCTYPQQFLTKASQCMSEFIASTILMFVIFALKDESNNGVSKVSLISSTMSCHLYPAFVEGRHSRPTNSA